MLGRQNDFFISAHAYLCSCRTFIFLPHRYPLRPVFWCKHQYSYIHMITCSGFFTWRSLSACSSSFLQPTGFIGEVGRCYRFYCNPLLSTFREPARRFHPGQAVALIPEGRYCSNHHYYGILFFKITQRSKHRSITTP